jgi:hypothetical protein
MGGQSTASIEGYNPFFGIFSFSGKVRELNSWHTFPLMEK